MYLKIRKLFFLLALAATLPVLAQNPICPMGVYMADPSAKVFDGELLVACSLDLSTRTWCSPYYHLLSSEDAVNWTLHRDVFAAVGPYDEVSYNDMPLYAPDMAKFGGKYFLYYDQPDQSEGVAIAESPAGPFKGGRLVEGAHGIDPCVFVDDDGQAYYFWGQFSAKGAKLNPDGVSIDPSTIVDGLVWLGFAEARPAFGRGGGNPFSGMSNGSVVVNPGPRQVKPELFEIDWIHFV